MGIYTLLLGLGTALGAAFGGILARHLHVNGLILGSLLLAIIGLLALNPLPAGPQPSTAHK